MKITNKQKRFILDNLEVLEQWQLEEIIKKTGIDNLDKEYASELIKDIIEVLNELKGTSYEDIFQKDRCKQIMTKKQVIEEYEKLMKEIEELKNGKC